MRVGEPPEQSRRPWPRDLWLGALDLVFPPACLVCGAYGEAFCARCRTGIAPAPLATEVPGLEAIASLGAHDGPLRDAVLALKFAGKLALVEPLGSLLGEALSGCREAWRPDLVVPVPIYWLRCLQRGFNQSDLLARAAAAPCGIAVNSKLLLRPHRRRPQVGLTAAERATNVQGALALRRGASLAGRRVVVVDDTWTTGATLGECAAVLRSAGAAAVFGLTVTGPA
jgi:ComF family protein